MIDQLEIKDNDHILETGMGPGDNFPLIRSKAENLKITGIDIQVQMMIIVQITFKNGMILRFFSELMLNNYLFVMKRSMWYFISEHLICSAINKMQLTR